MVWKSFLSRSTIDRLRLQLASTLYGDVRDVIEELIQTEVATSVQYALNKQPKDIWNMIAGAQFALNRNWYFRSEVGFLGSRTSLLVGTEYKFDI